MTRKDQRARKQANVFLNSVWEMLLQGVASGNIEAYVVTPNGNILVSASALRMMEPKDRNNFVFRVAPYA